MQTFQQPLSETKEAFYIHMLKDGTDEERQQAKQILIERNLRLVAHIVKKYQNVEEEMQDLISIGTIGLIKAVNTYDESKGSRLATYAARCIDNELLMLLRARKKISKEVSLYEPLGVDKEGNAISLLDVTGTEQFDVVERMSMCENLSRLHEYMDQILHDREKEILIMRYGLYGRKEMTQREIGDMLGISRSYVSRIEKKALRKLRGAFEDKKA
ncbi:MAG: RNA polymerase sporulation sigma factor SigK [Lachnospiraceae bacterium]|nr:RNA polymerase sporulation sigma factor SigK [Lachnospiraceae bacterium]